MKEVSIPSISVETLAAQLTALYKTFENCAPGEQLSFNLAKLEWTCPLLVLPLSAYIQTTGSNFIGATGKVASYLDTVKFPSGVDSVSSFEKVLQSGKTFIPISVLRREQGVNRDRLESMFAQLIVKVVGSVPGTTSAIYYPIIELLPNIFEHSNQNTGFIFGQWYPKKNYLDVCIVDRGRGLAQAYRDVKKLTLSHKEAVIEAMSGTSIKPDVDRGYGLRTSKRVVCEALRGGFVLVSGDAALYAFKNTERLVNLPNFSWQGVIIAYRIPKPTGPVNISLYLE